MAGLRTQERDIKMGHAKFGSSSSVDWPDTLHCFEPLLISLQFLFLLFGLTVQTGLIRDKFSQHVFGLVQLLLHVQQRCGGTFNTKNRDWCGFWKTKVVYTPNPLWWQLSEPSRFQWFQKVWRWQHSGSPADKLDMSLDDNIDNMLHQLQNLYLDLVQDEMRLYLQVDFFS